MDEASLEDPKSEAVSPKPYGTGIRLPRVRVQKTSHPSQSKPSTRWFTFGDLPANGKGNLRKASSRGFSMATFGPGLLIIAIVIVMVNQGQPTL